MSVGNAEGQNDLQHSEVRRSRRDRKCEACWATIGRGHLYVREVTVFWGDIGVTNRCGRCEAIVRHLVEVLPQGTAIDPNLMCGHDYEDEESIGRSPPPEIAALAFVTPAEATTLLVADYEKQRQARARKIWRHVPR